MDSSSDKYFTLAQDAFPIYFDRGVQHDAVLVDDCIELVVVVLPDGCEYVIARDLVAIILIKQRVEPVLFIEEAQTSP